MKFLISCMLLCFVVVAKAQPVINDHSNNAVLILPQLNIFGSTLKATETLSPDLCAVVPSFALDVWYKFSADGNSNFTITAQGKSGNDLVVSLYFLDNGNLSFVDCANSIGSDKCELTTEILPAGNYYYRVYAMWGGVTKFKTHLQKNSINSLVGYESQNIIEQKQMDLRSNHSDFLNPLISTSIISFSLPQTEKVSITIYDVSGNQIKALMDEWLDAGAYQLNWKSGNENGEALPDGVYQLKVHAQTFSQTLKLIVSK